MEFVYPEGATPLDPDEMEGLKHPHVETRAELDALEQQNIQDGYLWLDRQRKFKDYLTIDFLLELHKRLFGDVWSWAGTYRKTGKNIGVDQALISVEVRNLLDDAAFWVENTTYSREEFAARFHHRLVKTHPFANGNGRHARIMTDVILERVLDVDAINWGGALSSDSENRKLYINALRVADRGDYQPLIEFVSQ